MNDNAVVLVTGGAGGLGWAIAKAFHSEGRRVAVLDVNTLPQSAPSDIQAEKGDLRDFDAVAAAVERIERVSGHIGVLVNSAGVLEPAPVSQVDLSSWRRQIDINLGGVFNACRAVVPSFQGRCAGTIVNIASRLGLIGRANHAPYSASKFGVVGLTQSLALELAPFGVRVNAVCPGPIDNTGMRNAAEQSDVPEANRAERIARIPLGRFGRPEEVADLVKFLASNRASYITGQAIAICGGLSIA